MNTAIRAAVFVFLSLSVNLRAENEVKVQVKKISLELGSHVKEFVANRPSGWIPAPRLIERVRGINPQPARRIRLDQIEGDRQQTRIQRRNPETWIARTARIFGNRSTRGVTPLALLPLGCVSCSDPVLTLVNTTFEPISLYSYEDLGPTLRRATLLPGESVAMVLSYPGEWGFMAYGEYTETWIFDSGLVSFPCSDRDTWAITDPFAALDVANSTYSDLFLCANDAYCREPAGLIPSGLTYEFYFSPGTYRITLRDATWPDLVYFDSVLALFANELTLLELSY